MDRWSSVVYWSVCHTRELCKNGRIACKLVWGRFVWTQ